ncbi:OmpA family protein [Vibrio nigripulchritudo]|uniref:OmpA family protein n=1 Tax=Vibrio nigripulchritudo TaxID=28173 RepID=UPI002491E83B|nr:OmpA family protein [Vibrio nigripulchritudo]BDU39733.1 membrane protein [Vibrio nigripulchritudo]BDU45456.1 membrane protein [Vibrio nigripulchritudo]
MKLSLKPLAALLALSASCNVLAKTADSHALNFYCGGEHIEYEKKIEVGQGTRVALNQGPFYQIEQSQKEPATEAFISQQIVSSGIDKECSEYLLTNSTLQFVNDSQVVARVFFGFDQAKLTHKSRYILDSIAKQISASNGALVVEGHTDSTGSEKYNMTLGLKRSEAVARYLEEKGVDKSLLNATSKGETMPVQTNHTDGGKALNRRVEIKQ